MTAADLTRVLEIAAGLPESPHWPESAYLDALNPESTPRRIALVAAGLEEVDGFTVASLLPPQAELESIAVAAGSQRRGLGRTLFDALVKDLLPVDRPVAARAAILRGKRKSLSMPDALILATADLQPEIETVLCADGDWLKVKGLGCKVELLKVDTPTGDDSDEPA